MAIMSVDNLPCELPKEASAQFSRKLLPLLMQSTKHRLHASLQRGIVTKGGKLTDAFQYMESLRAMNRSAQKNVLLLGSGMVAGPLVEYLMRDPLISMTIASNAIQEAENLAKRHDKVTLSYWAAMSFIL